VFDLIDNGIEFGFPASVPVPVLLCQPIDLPAIVAHPMLIERYRGRTLIVDAAGADPKTRKQCATIPIIHTMTMTIHPWRMKRPDSMLLSDERRSLMAMAAHDRANFRLAEPGALLGLYQSKLVTTEVRRLVGRSKTLEKSNR